MKRHLRAGPVASVAALGLGTALMFAGCNKNSTAPPVNNGGGSPPGTSTLVGTMAGAAVGGSMRVTLPTANPEPQSRPASVHTVLTVTGTFGPNGGPVSLSGTYDTSTKALSVTGGGYTFTGTYFSGVLKGTWQRTTPSAATGSFILVFQTAANSVHTYCGTFTSTSGGEGGRFNLVIQGTTIDGIAVTVSGLEVPLQGTLGGGTSITLVNPQNPGPYLATGTLDAYGGTVSGTYNDGAGNSGNWSGIEC